MLCFSVWMCSVLTQTHSAPHLEAGEEVVCCQEPPVFHLLWTLILSSVMGSSLTVFLIQTDQTDCFSDQWLMELWEHCHLILCFLRAESPELRVQDYQMIAVVLFWQALLQPKLFQDSTFELQQFRIQTSSSKLTGASVGLLLTGTLLLLPNPDDWGAAGSGWSVSGLRRGGGGLAKGLVVCSTLSLCLMEDLRLLKNSSFSCSWIWPRWGCWNDAWGGRLDWPTGTLPRDGLGCLGLLKLSCCCCWPKFSRSSSCCGITSCCCCCCCCCLNPPTGCLLTWAGGLGLLRPSWLETLPAVMAGDSGGGGVVRESRYVWLNQVWHAPVTWSWDWHARDSGLNTRPSPHLCLLALPSIHRKNMEQSGAEINH